MRQGVPMLLPLTTPPNLRSGFDPFTGGDGDKLPFVPRTWTRASTSSSPTSGLPFDPFDPDGAARVHSIVQVPTMIAKFPHPQGLWLVTCSSHC